MKSEFVLSIAIAILAIFFQEKLVFGKEYFVRTSDELENALMYIHRGDKIILGAARYQGNFVIKKQNKITIEGKRQSLFYNSGSNKTAFSILSSNNIKLSGFHIHGGNKGIFIEDSKKVSIKDVVLEHLTESAIEAISPSDSLDIENCIIQHIGSATSKELAMGINIYKPEDDNEIIEMDKKGKKKEKKTTIKIMKNKMHKIFGPMVMVKNIHELRVKENKFDGRMVEHKDLAESRDAIEDDDDENKIGCWVDSSATINKIENNKAEDCPSGTGFLIRLPESFYDDDNNSTMTTMDEEDDEDSKPCKVQFKSNECKFTMTKDGNNKIKRVFCLMAPEECENKINKKSNNVKNGGLSKLIDHTVDENDDIFDFK